jgi:hypothetical protein
MPDRPLLGQGELVDERPVRNLEREISALHAKLREAQAANDRLVEQADEAKRVLRPIRRQLEPFFNALQVLFGQLDAAGVESAPSANVGAPTSRSAMVWEVWKKKLPGKPADIIQALLEHGEMSVAQIRVAAQCGQQTVYDVTTRLHRLGLINRNGGRYSLKEL